MNFLLQKRLNNHQCVAYNCRKKFSASKEVKMVEEEWEEDDEEEEEEEEEEW